MFLKHTKYISKISFQYAKHSKVLSHFYFDRLNGTLSFISLRFLVERRLRSNPWGLLYNIFSESTGVCFADRGNDILDNCTRNVLANSSSYPDGENSVRVRNLDWENPWPPAPCESIGGKSEGDPVRSFLCCFWLTVEFCPFSFHFICDCILQHSVASNIQDFIYSQIWL
jgi:hypothetical protein